MNRASFKAIKVVMASAAIGTLLKMHAQVPTLVGQVVGSSTLAAPVAQLLLVAALALLVADLTINDLPHRWSFAWAGRWVWAGTAVLSLVYLMLGAGVLLVAPVRSAAHWAVAGAYCTLAALGFGVAIADRWSRIQRGLIGSAAAAPRDSRQDIACVS